MRFYDCNEDHCERLTDESGNYYFKHRQISFLEYIKRKLKGDKDVYLEL